MGCVEQAFDSANAHRHNNIPRLVHKLTISLRQSLDVVDDGVPPLVRGHARVAAEVVRAALYICKRNSTVSVYIEVHKREKMVWGKFTKKIFQSKVHRCAKIIDMLMVTVQNRYNHRKTHLALVAHVGHAPSEGQRSNVAVHHAIHHRACTVRKYK